MTRQDFIFSLGQASVAALAAREIPYCPNEKPDGQKLASMVKVSEEVYDEVGIKDAFNQVLKTVPPGYGCFRVDVGYAGPTEDGPGDFPLSFWAAPHLFRNLELNELC